MDTVVKILSIGFTGFISLLGFLMVATAVNNFYIIFLGGPRLDKNRWPVIDGVVTDHIINVTTGSGLGNRLSAHVLVRIHPNGDPQSTVMIQPQVLNKLNFKLANTVSGERSKAEALQELRQLIPAGTHINVRYSPTQLKWPMVREGIAEDNPVNKASSFFGLSLMLLFGLLIILICSTIIYFQL